MGADRNPRVHVVAAILTDLRGRILLSRRTEGRDLAGLWEFPGGKVEPGESPESALERELREEIGIEIGATQALIAVPHQYSHKRILLDVRRVAEFRGRVRGRESQALAWVAPEKLADYAMPAADRPVVAALMQPARYLITPEPGSDQRVFLAALDRALDRGIRRVQLRAKALDATQVRSLSKTVSMRVEAAGGELLLNAENADAEASAKELGCGLHLTAARLRTISIRPLLASQRVAASCHDARELQLAQALGCDFAVLGPVAATPSHSTATPLGWAGFAALRECTALPIYALGGLSEHQLTIARAHGAQGIAAQRAFWPEP